MKKQSAFREQITGYDCVPTSFINALVYLYERDDIPTGAIREIYASTLDINEGTSGGAVESLCNRLNQIENKKFKIKCVQKIGDDVNFNHSLSKKSCWLICVYGEDCEGHYITAFYKKNGFLYCFDPYYGEGTIENKWEFGKFEKGCNLRINLGHLKSSKTEKYCAGKKSEREMVVITKRI